MRSVARWVLTLAPPSGGGGDMAERNRAQPTGQDDRTPWPRVLGINPGLKHVDREEDWVGYDAFLGEHQSTPGRTKDNGTARTETVRDRNTALSRPESAAKTSDYYRGYSAAWDYCSEIQEWNAANGDNRLKSATLLAIFSLAILLSALGGFV